MCASWRAVFVGGASGDEWDSLLTEKPADVAPPPLLEVRRRTTFEDFQRTSQDLEKMLQQDAAKLGPLGAWRWKGGRVGGVELGSV